MKNVRARHLSTAPRMVDISKTIKPFPRPVPQEATPVADRLSPPIETIDSGARAQSPNTVQALANLTHRKYIE
jgi:hypothetical protein